MFDHRHYVPILKGKMGEYTALAELHDAEKEGLTPLIEVPAVPWDYAEEAAARSLTEHIEPVAERILEHWGSQRRVFVDLLLVSDDPALPDGRHPISHVCERARACGLMLVPVTGPGRSASYQQAVGGAIAQDGRGVCLRLQSEDFDQGGADQVLGDVVDVLGVEPEQVDLVLDMGSIPEGGGGIYSMAVRGTLVTVPHLTRWRTITLASAAFPVDLSGFDRDAISMRGRADWRVWHSLVTNRGSIPRLPAFGDYAIAHPETTLIDPRMMNPSASIRYTTPTDWLIVRGHGVRSREGYDQFYGLARQLVRHPEYCGADFSWGDGYIYRCAERSEGPGNLTTWRKVGTNHHIAMVVRQIASLS